MLHHARRSVARTLSAGFTLIELLAVILIISILMFFLLPKIPEAMDQANVTACKKNLGEIYSGLVMYNTKHKDLPKEGGAKFIGALIASGVWNNTKDRAESLSCPAVKRSALTGLSAENPEDWFRTLDGVDGTYSAYAGRDVKRFPLRRFPDGSGKEVLVADDNDPEMNHRTTTCALLDSGVVATYELYELQEKGILDKEAEHLVVGPDSPIEELRKVSLD
ncbi:MAG: prepilin-type N-terminal cleavage/methylation domain-containing protein [Planctomycetes bacterium]|nr:prepilin-type N-terminal cleavage/methylation domain-containing protein [Planctomycetota bacterium]